MSVPARCIDAVRRDVARRLRGCGIATPELDARILVGHALSLDLTGLVAQGRRVLGAGEIACIDELVARRRGREPVARITGTREFWGLPFKVTPQVLVPRPETETVVEGALALARAGTPAGVPARRIADLGVGSGVIMIALLRELPDATAIGTDCDAGALATARANAQSLGVAGRASFAACDFAAAVAPGCDLIVTNPPYVRTGEIAALEPDVRAYDPRRALDGGADGLAAYRVIARQAAAVLAPGGPLVGEIGFGQGPEVAALLEAAGFGAITLLADLAGTHRVVTARRR